MWISSLSVAIGSAIGGLCRFWFNEFFITLIKSDLPLGTIIVNVTGCFIIGLFGAITGPEGRYTVPVLMKHFVMIGLCGGYTTFSAFSYQTLTLLHKGEWFLASLNVFLSVILCLFAVWLGDWVSYQLSTSR
jgi:CrcB protein